MRLVFLGTPEAAVVSLEALLAAGHDVALVVTRPDRKRGRGGELSPSPVKKAALEHDVPVTHRLADAADVGAERGVVVAYGAIIPATLLDVLPMLNVHFSLLPRWRGAAPVQRAILAGDQETGVSIISLEPTLDTGPVHLERRVTIGDDTADELTRRLAETGAEALVEVLASRDLLDHPIAQSGESIYASKIEPDEYRLSPTMTSEMASRTVRLGRAYFVMDGKRVVVDAARMTSDVLEPGSVAEEQGEVLLGLQGGSLALVFVRPEGRATMAARSWWGDCDRFRTDDRGPRLGGVTVIDAGSTGEIRIAPSILSADFGELGRCIEEVDAETDWLHVDVMDGHFVPNITIGPPVVASLRQYSARFFDCHLMMTDPERYLEAFARAGANGCSVHVEIGNTLSLIEQARSLGLRIGLAANPDTPFEAVAPFLGDIDLLLLMTVFPGFGGQSFIGDVMEKVAKAREEIDRLDLALDIEVDGGIDVETAPIAIRAGANVLVAGSAIFAKPDPLGAARELREAALGVSL